MTDVTEMLARSRLGLDQPIRDVLEKGRTVRSRNRDGEYAIVLSDDQIFRKRFTQVGWVADERADWTIVVTDFTLRNVAKAEADGDPTLIFWAPVIDRTGKHVGTMRVNASPYGQIGSDQGEKKTRVVFFSSLRDGDLFCSDEAFIYSARRFVLFRATADATSTGRVEARSVGTGEPQVFDLGPDHLTFKVI
jgi:hypothetical protein